MLHPKAQGQGYTMADEGVAKNGGQGQRARYLTLHHSHQHHCCQQPLLALTQAVMWAGPGEGVVKST